VPCGPTCQQFPLPCFEQQRRPCRALARARRSQAGVGLPPLAVTGGALPNPAVASFPPSPTSLLSRLKCAQGCPLSSDPLSKLACRRNPLLTRVEAEAAAFSPLPGELLSLVHRVIDWAAPHPPLSAALLQEPPEPVTAVRQHRAAAPSRLIVATPSQ
jgi:hypothetical protein